MDLSKNLKELRKSRNLTQYQLSKILNIGQATIAGYENGTREPHINSLIAYANFFQCSIDYLMGREDDFGNITIHSEVTTPQLSTEERQLLENFRALPNDLKRRAENYLQSLSDAARQERLTMYQKS